MLERDIEKRLVTGVRALGGRAYKFISPGRDGVPDRIVILPGGKIIFVELKAERGRLSPLQRDQLEILDELGCNTTVLKGAEMVNRFLEESRCNLNHTHTSSTL